MISQVVTGVRVGLRFCGFSATLTRDFYISLLDGLTESVPKRTVIGL